MRAVQVKEFGDPPVMRIAEVPLAEPAPGQVQVRVQAAGVNPVDTYIRAGAYSVLPELPYIPGKDAAGVVTALGSGVSHLAVGQRVYVAGLDAGAYAEGLVAPAAAVHALPESVDFAPGSRRGGAVCHRLLRPFPIAPRPGPVKPRWYTGPPGRWAWPRYSWPWPPA